MKHLQKSLSLFLCIVMCLSFFPFSAAYAEDAESVEEEPVLAEDELVQPSLQDNDSPEEEEDSSALEEEIVIDSEERQEDDSPAVEEEDEVVIEEVVEEEDEVVNEAIVEEDAFSDDAMRAVLHSGTSYQLTWELDSKGTLIISGTGKMATYLNPESNKPSLANVDWRPYRAQIVTVIINPGATEIGANAFNGCSNLKSVTIPEGVTSIESNAFRGCYSLTSITIPEGVTSIEGFTFWECTNLKTVIIPESVKSIAPYAFRKCSRLESITIPGAVGKGAFRECSSLTSVTFLEGATSIEEGAFYDCSNLKNVTILDGMKSIEPAAFEYCTSLTSITFPESVRRIGSSSFYHCASLEEIRFSGTPPVVSSSIFGYDVKADAFFPVDKGWTEDHQQSFGGRLTWIPFQSQDLSTGYISISDQYYTGNAIYPTVSVYCGNKLIENQDYILQYENNIYPGTAKVTAVGRGNYYGILTGSFDIKQPGSGKTIWLLKNNTLNNNTIECTMDTEQLILKTAPSEISAHDAYFSCSGPSITSNNQKLYGDTQVFDCSKLSEGTYVFEAYRWVEDKEYSNGAYHITDAYYACQGTCVLTVKHAIKPPVLRGIEACKQPTDIDYKSLLLEVNPIPSNAVLPAVSWKSSDTSVATVEDGIVTLKKAGSFRITATANGKSVSWDFNIAPLDIKKTEIVNDGQNENKPKIKYQGQYLRDDVDYQVVSGTYNGVKIVGINLFSGELTWKDDTTAEHLFRTTLNMDAYTGINIQIHLPDGANPADYTVKTEPQNSMYPGTGNTVSLVSCGTTTVDGLLYYRINDAMKAASTEMTDTVKVTLFKNGEEVKSEEYSVSSIVQERLNEGMTEDREALNRALVQYGRYAQIRFGHKTGNLPVVSGAPSLTAIPSSYAAKGDPTTMTKYISQFEAKIEMADSVKMNVYLTPAKGYGINDFTVSMTCAGAVHPTMSAPVMRNGKIFVQISGLLSYEMDKDVKITVKLKNTNTSATWTRSLITCAYENYQTAGDNAARKNLMMSLYQYFLAAQNRFLN